MATQKPAIGAPIGEFAELLLAEKESASRAQVIAEQAASLTGAAVVVYLFDAGAAPRWAAKASVGDVSAPARCEALTLHMLAERREPLLFAHHELVREHYSHLDVRRTVASMAYAPMALDGLLIGAIEAIGLDRALTTSDLQVLASISDLSAIALATALTYENERNANLQSITRLAQFYDLEKVFHSTLQIGELMPIITAKIRELIEVQAVNLWMVADEDVLLMARSGDDPTLAIGASADEIIQFASDEGKWLNLRGPEPRLTRRNGGNERGPIRTVLAYPVIYGDSLVGVLECVNKAGGATFNEDDVFFLGTVAETAARALHNASLLEAERKIEILETLVEVSNEITSTLNLERVLQVLVNGPQQIMAYDRASVSLEDRRKLRVRAISGKPEIVASDPAVKLLRETLEWAAGVERDLYLSAHNGKVEADREETRAKFEAYFKTSGFQSWYSVPLADDQGRLGMLCFESRRPDFLNDAQLELVKVLAAQATVAVRNASLYTEVPFIGLLQPLLEKKQRFMAMESRRRAGAIALAVAALAFLVLVPLPMRVDGTATVAPQRTAQIHAESDGVVRRVYVREGDPVKKGTTLADMDDADYRAQLAGAEARYQIALAAMNRALASSDGTEAGMQRTQADYWASEAQRAKERLEQTHLRSPIDGIVATPYVENLVGRKLAAGDPFAEVIDTAHTSVDVAVEQTDLPLVQPGQSAAVKLESFPTRKFRGQVTVTSPASGMEGDQRVFFARVDVPNPDGAIRSGMQGRAKVSTGWRPAGVVLFRDAGMWAWSKLWSWFGG
jgi:RND family efflux transporter MFP subunit